MSEEWYGVRCLFSHGPSDTVEDAVIYEERVVLIRAPSFDEAVERAEREAVEYTRDLVNVEYLDFAQAYALTDDPFRDGAEVFSLMRSSLLQPSAYIDRHFDTGSEHEQKRGGNAA